jgi:hypothetical protein
MFKGDARRVLTGKVRFSYCNVMEAYAFNKDEKAKFSVRIIIPKTDKTKIAEIKEAMDAAANESLSKKWGGKMPKDLYAILRDGDDDDKADESTENCWFMNCSSGSKPGVLDENGQPIIDATEVYSGCYGRVSISFFGYNSNGNKGVACGLDNVQKLADGESLGGTKPSASNDFDEVDHFA